MRKPTMTIPRRRFGPGAVERRHLAAPAAAALLLLAGCGSSADEYKPGPEVGGGAANIDASVSATLKVLQVEFPYPADGVYSKGEELPLQVAISNTGTAADTLVNVTGPDFTAARGTAPSLAVAVPPHATTFVGAPGAPTLTLLGLTRDLHSSQSIPVTFTFAHAGQVTVPAVVAPEGRS